jgi:hypothetical protein
MSPDNHSPVPVPVELRVPNTSMLPPAEGAAPQAWHTSQNVRDEWPAQLRRAVRSKPVAAVAAAVLLGLLFGRITR